MPPGASATSNCYLPAAQMDIEHLLDEFGDIGKSEHRELESRL
jgi:hypothetical protein